MAAFMPSLFRLTVRMAAAVQTWACRPNAQDTWVEVEDVIISTCFSVIVKTTYGGLDYKYTLEKSKREVG